MLALLAAPALAQPYRNPVIPLGEAEIADPFVLKFNGEYYLYASGDPITAYHSRDLVRWRPLGPVLRSQSGAWNEADLWAPEVVYRDGKFLMYYTASRKSSDWRVGEMARRVGVAVSDSPAGPFVDSGRPVLGEWAIDGNLLRDPADGREYLFYSSLEEPNHPGAAVKMKPLPQGKTVPVTRGDRAWEDKDGDPNNGSLRYTNEGPTTWERQGRYYCFYSGGSWDLPTYAVAYATAPRPTGPWTKVDPPILRSTPAVDGPGHNALVRAPNNLDDIHFYHARLQPYLDPWNRVPFADRLWWNGDHPYAAPPGLGLQAQPDLPILWERFDGELSNWTGSGWSVRDGVLDGQGELISRHPLPPHFLLEANVRNGGGLTLGDHRLHLDPARRALTWNDKPLWRWPADFRADVFHQLLIHDGVIEVDGVRRAPLPAVSGRQWGLFSQRLSQWDGIALSAGYTDDFRHSPIEPSGWQLEGKWQQRSGQGQALKGEPSTRYEFSATLQPADREAPLVARPGRTDQTWKAGIVAGGPLRAGFDKAIWPLGRFWVNQHSFPLPRGFRYDRPHTVRVLRQDSGWTFWLDGQEIAALWLDLPPSVPGLWSEGISSEFFEATWKRVNVEQNRLLNGGFESEPSPVWKLSGAARLNESQAHSGLRRLLLNGGEARQNLEVPAGNYRLHLLLRGSGPLRVVLGKVRREFSGTEKWRSVTCEAALEGPTALTLAGTHLAVDDLYLERLHSGNAPAAGAGYSNGVRIASAAYTNPVIRRDAPDPGVLRVDGDDYYLASTGGDRESGAFPLYHSKDMVSWERVGQLFPPGQVPDWSDGSYWAPEIHPVGSGYVAYFTARDREGRLRVGAATSQNPQGPFTDLGRPLVADPNIGVIDPTFFRDEDGRQFLYWKEDGNDFNPPRPSRIMAQQLDESGTALVGERVEVLRNDPATWEGTVVEAPDLEKRGDYYYLFYSGNSYADGRYAEGVARSRTPLGPFEKAPRPFLTSNQQWIGPGHAAVSQDDQGRPWLVYHAWDRDHSGRMVLLDPLHWGEDGWPRLDGPSTGGPKP